MSIVLPHEDVAEDRDWKIQFTYEDIAASLTECVIQGCELELVAAERERNGGEVLPIGAPK